MIDTDPLGQAEGTIGPIGRGEDLSQAHEAHRGPDGQVGVLSAPLLPPKGGAVAI